jgi:NAD(P)H dehydrogenase (quinone)
MGKIIITAVDGNFGGMAAERIMKEEAKENLIFTSPVQAVVDKYKTMDVDARISDYNNPEGLAEAFKGGETMLMISMPIVGEKRIKMHKNAIDAAKTAGVERIVYTSIVSAGDPTCDALVGEDHETTENYIIENGFKYIFCRNSQYAEALPEFSLPEAFASGVWSSNQGGGKMAYVSRTDCAKAAVELARGKGTDNTIYNITGPELLTLEDIVAICKEVTGREIKIMQATDEETYAQFDAIEVPRTTDNGMKDSPIPWCSDDMVSFGRAVREDKMSAYNHVFAELVGEQMTTMKDLIIKANEAGLYK